VSSEGGSKYRIYARVPSGAFGWMYTRGIGAGLAALLLVGIGNAKWDSGHQNLMILNAFPKDVTVQVEGKTVTVPAHGKTTVNLTEGQVALSAKFADGFVVDELKQEIKADSRLPIWNLAGAAPLMREPVVYVQDGSSGEGAAGEPEIFCGQNFVEPASADYEFETPPAEVSMSKHQKTVTRSHLDVIEIPGMKQEDTCNSYLLSKEQVAKAAPILRALAAVNGYDAGAVGFASFASRRESPQSAVAFLEKVHKAKPQDIDLQRMYQGVLREAGQSARVEEEFKRAAEQNPDSASAQYLAAALLEGEEGVQRLLELSQRFDESYILRSLAWRQWAHGHPAEAAQTWERLLAKSPADAARSIDAKVGAELALQHPERARAAIDKLFATPDVQRSPGMASDYALLSAKLGGDAEAMFAKLETDESQVGVVDYFRVRAGLEPSAEGSTGMLLELAKAFRTGAPEAMAATRKLSDLELVTLPAEDWTLLFTEAARTKDQELITKLRGSSQFEAKAMDALQAFARGEAVKLEGLDIDPVSRAAASLVRARNQHLPASERENLRRLALAGDPLHGSVSVAAKSWHG
jgi:tetratricopeptide (TPR) repeat protein